MTESSDLHEVELAPKDLDPLLQIIAPRRRRDLMSQCEKWRSGTRGRIWHVNSTSEGGGVAEIIRSIGGYSRSAGIQFGWLVIDAPPEFFTITKRIDNGVSGTAGDGGALTQAERDLYTAESERLGRALAQFVGPGDVVVLHDPQTAGMTRYASETGSTVVWRAHNGCDQENRYTLRAWTFLLPHIVAADAVVMTLDRFIPPLLRASGLPCAALAPCIDPFSTRNATMPDERVRRELAAAGFGDSLSHTQAATSNRDGIIGCGSGPKNDDPLVVQVSRWDAVKDMAGTMQAFAEYVVPYTDAHLLLAGPEVSGITDDPEAEHVHRSCLDTWRRLPVPARSRIRLACLPMKNLEHNASLVNALQRRADVVTQKSTSEGFGLTATEAMWKSKAVVVGDIGGLGYQAEGGAGIAVPPRDRREFGRAVRTLLADHDTRTAIGRRAHARVLERFLPDTHITRELALLERFTRRATA